jgi:hypothetical protein
MPPVFGYHSSFHLHSIPTGYPVCTSVTYNTIASMYINAFGVEINGMRFRYIVTSSILTKECYDTMQYRCEYEELGRSKTINLIYYIKEHRWTAG